MMLIILLKKKRLIYFTEEEKANLYDNELDEELPLITTPDSNRTSSKVSDECSVNTLPQYFTEGIE